jgi:signal transduction histidine kinase
MEVVRTESLKVYPTLPEPERPRRHGHPHGGPWWRKAPEPPKTREQLAFEEARRAVDARVGFYRHAIFYGLFILFILFTGGLEPAVVVGLLWGMGLATHGYNAIVAPNLRKKWLEEEYRLRLGPGELQARRQIEGKHAKSLEALSASIAHEIRNPITAAKSLVQQMGEDPVANENVEYAKVALEELDRVERSIAHLLRYAREEDVHRESMALGDVVASAVETFRDRLARTEVEVVQSLDEDTRMQGDPEKLRRVVINLVGNAIDELEESHTPDPRITITGGVNLAGTEVWFKVADNGPGIPQDKLTKIFSPFYTSKEGGTGLGLAITKKLVEAHDGNIEVRSTEGLGTEFELVFPRAPGSEEA